MTDEIQENIMRVFRQRCDDRNHRQRSWEHCYLHFRKPANEDLDALHLAFFLASWGMYRGSSNLLKKDYKVHIPIVREFRKDRYARLWHAGISEEIDLLFELVEELKRIYEEKGVSATDTLITKVFLGTLCCTPAYDTYFKEGVKAWNSRHSGETKLIQTFGRNSYRGLLRFYHKHDDELRETQAKITQCDAIEYPMMKLIDMYFLNLGRENK